jgi:aspartate kinase
MIVMKFGGTSVEDARAIERVAAIVKDRLAQRPVVVVSAMAKVTDTLLTMARAAGAGERKAALKLCRSLQERHYNTASELLGTALFTDFHSELGSEFEGLDELLRGISAVGELTPRTTDHVAAFRGNAFRKIVASAFAATGLNGVHVDSREFWSPTATTWRRCRRWKRPTSGCRQGKAAARCGAGPGDGRVHWSESRGITTTIGRGGSDFSAAIVGAGLGAERIEIWTDVDGILDHRSADLPGGAAHQSDQLRRGGGVGLLWREGAPSGDGAAGDSEKYSGVCAELAKSLVRRERKSQRARRRERIFSRRLR